MNEPRRKRRRANVESDANDTYALTPPRLANVGDIDVPSAPRRAPTRLSDAYVAGELEAVRERRARRVCQTLRRVRDDLRPEECARIYIAAVSLHQDTAQNRGSVLEAVVQQILEDHNIRFWRQVTIDANGYIVAQGACRAGCHHVVDFVVGDAVAVGAHVSDCVVVSCKTSCRERWTQDNWTLRHPPKRYVLVTISNDYPPADRFHASPARIIITINPKQRNACPYVMSFDELVPQIMSAVPRAAQNRDPPRSSRSITRQFEEAP